MQLTEYRRSSNEIMSSNISNPFPKKSDNPSISVRKKSGDLDETEKALVTNTDTVVKEGNNDMGTKPNEVKEAITPLIAKNNIDTVKKQINHKHPIKQQIHTAAINLTKVNHWINQGLLKEVTQKTQLTQ